MSVFAGRSPEGSGWYRVYEWSTFNDVATFAYDIDRSGSAPVFTRVLYQLVFSAYSVWCEMDDFTGGNALRVGVPLTWSYDAAVTNLSVYFSPNAVGYPQANAATIYNRTAATGRINFWPSDYGAGADGIYNDVDASFSATNGYGSMQVFDTTTTPSYCIFSWSSWGTNGAYGLGSNGSTVDTDWTFVTNSATITPRLGRVFVK